MHQQAIMIHILLKFHEILLIGYLVTTHFVNLRLFKGNNSSTTEATLTKMYVKTQNYGDTYLL